MNLLVYLVLFGWIPVVLYLFHQLPVQRALVLSFIGAWLFLPQASFPLIGLPDFTKMSATCYGILLATIIFDAQRFRLFKWSWIDTPMLIWCLCPVLSSLTNGLGLYDGLSAALEQTVTWGFPYFLGRLYLGNLGGLQQLALGIMGGGLFYVPLCWLEIRLSPQLHRWLYGYHAHSFAQTMRLGGFRPTVFMEHGLMVGVWMMTATLMAIWLWRAGTFTHLWNMPMVGLVLVLGLTFIFLKSTGAYVLLVLSVILLFVVTRSRTSFALWLLALLMAGYLAVGTTGLLTPASAQQIVATTRQVTGPERAQSLEFRLNNERILATKARQRPIFGWGGWGRARVYDEQGQDISVTDSLWIIAFGKHGLVGLVSLMTALVLPILSMTRRIPVANWTHPAAAPVAALAIALFAYSLDCLVNAMVNPVFTLAAGGLSGLAVQDVRRRVRYPRPIRIRPPGPQPSHSRPTSTQD